MSRELRAALKTLGLTMEAERARFYYNLIVDAAESKRRCATCEKRAEEMLGCHRVVVVCG